MDVSTRCGVGCLFESCTHAVPVAKYFLLFGGPSCQRCKASSTGWRWQCEANVVSFAFSRFLKKEEAGLEMDTPAAKGTRLFAAFSSRDEFVGQVEG